MLNFSNDETLGVSSFAPYTPEGKCGPEHAAPVPYSSYQSVGAVRRPRQARQRVDVAALTLIGLARTVRSQKPASNLRIGVASEHTAATPNRSA
jgi:hypothetical protein